ncbi:hydrogenase maturation protease [candidate division Kazan bacterium]|uniref:Hydrogenase maturation protease n=1 Tax=candidate division Kazan bacterium TaxID=2202143 RepID=A0A420ZBE2_UNCK3|nr:MAG: hydrogenase maturation protease [candidate division Kazan bacterium]
MNTERILILGIGNVLMGDEGIGVHAIRYLEQKELPDDVDLLDGGTGGFHLLSEMAKYKKVVMIDATLGKDPEGTLTVIKPRFSSDFPSALSAHDVGLKDLIEALQLTGLMPEMYLITVSINPYQELGMELSMRVSGQLPFIYEKVKGVLNMLMREKKI